MVNASAELTAAFDAGVTGLLDRIRGLAEARRRRRRPSGWSAWDRFQAQFECRGPNEWELRSPTWGTEPALPLAAIDRMRLAADADSPQARSDVRRRRPRAGRPPRSGRRWPPTRRRSASSTPACGRPLLFNAGRERTKTNCVRVLHEVRLAALRAGAAADRGRGAATSRGTSSCSSTTSSTTWWTLALGRTVWAKPDPAGPGGRAGGVLPRAVRRRAAVRHPGRSAAAERVAAPERGRLAGRGGHDAGGHPGLPGRGHRTGPGRPRPGRPARPPARRRARGADHRPGLDAAVRAGGRGRGRRRRPDQPRRDRQPRARRCRAWSRSPARPVRSPTVPSSRWTATRARSRSSSSRRPEPSMPQEGWITDTPASTRFPVYTRSNANDVLPEPASPLGATLVWIPGVIEGFRDGQSATARSRPRSWPARSTRRSASSTATSTSTPRWSGCSASGRARARRPSTPSSSATGRTRRRTSPTPTTCPRRRRPRIGQQMGWVHVDDRASPSSTTRRPRPTRLRPGRPDLDGHDRWRARGLRPLAWCRSSGASSATTWSPARTPPSVRRSLAQLTGGHRPGPDAAADRVVGRRRLGPAVLRHVVPVPRGQRVGRGDGRLRPRRRAASSTGCGPAAARRRRPGSPTSSGSSSTTARAGPNEWDPYYDSWESRPELALALIDRMRGVRRRRQPAHPPRAR